MINNLTELLGKEVVVGITYMLATGDIDDVVQLHGVVREIDPIVEIDTGKAEPFILPPLLDVFSRAEPGDFTFKSTGEVVRNPDYTSIWTLTSPGDAP